MKFARNEVNGGGKVAIRAIAAGFCLGPLDQAVDAFKDSVIDAGVEPAEDAVPAAADCFSDVYDGWDVAVCGPERPLAGK